MSNETWDGIERRHSVTPTPGTHGGASDAAFLSYIVSQLETVNAKLNAIHIDTLNHRAETVRMEIAINDIKQAFPKDEEGLPDIGGHHDHHWRLIQASKSWGEIWMDVRKKVFGGMAWAVLLFVLWAIWEEIKRRVLP